MFLFFAIVPALLIAGDINEVIGTEAWILEIISQLGTLKGATTMMIVAFAVQAAMKFFKTPLAEFAGKWRLLIVAGMTIGSMVVAGLAAGMDLKSIMSGAGMLTAVQVFLNQVWQKFFGSEKPVKLIQ